MRNATPLDANGTVATARICRTCRPNVLRLGDFKLMQGHPPEWRTDSVMPGEQFL